MLVFEALKLKVLGPTELVIGRELAVEVGNSKYECIVKDNEGKVNVKLDGNKIYLDGEGVIDLFVFTSEDLGPIS